MKLPCPYPKSICLALLLSLPGLLSAADENELLLSGSFQPEVPHRYADIVLEGDKVSGSLTLQVKDGDAGRSADLYLVAHVRNDQLDSWYQRVGKEWFQWNGSINALQAMTSKVLDEVEVFDALNQDELFAGVYEVYAGYRTSGGSLQYNPEPYRFEVQGGNADSLVRFSSEAAMEAYLKEGMLSTSTTDYYQRSSVLTLEFDAKDTSGNAAPAGGAESRSSTTNLQEGGVDEADIIKTGADHLYMLKSCSTGACLDILALDSNSAEAALLGSFQFADSAVPGGMYLIEDESAETGTVITISGQNYYYAWYSIWGWGEQKTGIDFIDVADPTAPGLLDSLSIDGSLVSSRRVGNRLYVVTRYTPTLAGYYPYPVDKQQETDNAEKLAQTALTDMLPRVRDSEDNVVDLLKDRDCYLPTSAVDRNINPSIITITSIPLESPQEFSSTCYLGDSETLYMTPDALYLATTSWDYQVRALDDLIYSPQHSTSIHKFSLNNGSMVYSGSGTVQGHLGWTEDKKSFRMGEHDGYLNVVTSIGESWNDSSTTRLSVLREGIQENSLETLAVIDGIGKKGEQLYAARFLGDRAYLVTFRITDPLYVVDLGDQEHPFIAGELEIEGYSDYLHPVSENLLLGIGKDAVPDDGSSDFGGVRGAWYQGVKLALFDVSDPENPVEVDSHVLGRRGTESEVLWDHHAFTWLPPIASEAARVAIPVTLHETTPEWEGFDPASPSAWYDYTHTALYSFEVSESGISQVGRIISEDRQSRFYGEPCLVCGSNLAFPTLREVPDDDTSSTSLFAPVYLYFPDRSVLKDEAVFYLHNGNVLGSFWGESKDAKDAE